MTRIFISFIFIALIFSPTLSHGKDTNKKDQETRQPASKRFITEKASTKVGVWAVEDQKKGVICYVVHLSGQTDIDCVKIETSSP